MAMKRIFVLAALFLVLTADNEAEAQRRQRGNANYVERHLTLPRRTLRFDLGPFERGLSDSGMINGPFSGPYGSNAYGLRLEHLHYSGSSEGLLIALGSGAGYGITDRVEVGALFLPMIISEGANRSHYGDLTTYMRFAFVDHRVFQMGFHGVVQFPTRNGFGFGFGVPININITDILRIETGAECEIRLDAQDTEVSSDVLSTRGGEPVISMDVPIALTARIARRGFLGGRADLFFNDLPRQDRNFRSAFGATGGLSLFGRRATIADFTGQMLVFVDRFIDWELTFGANVSLGL